ncbi:MAG: DUF2877 domain-containing protein [Actinomycetota bacterium]
MTVRAVETRSSPVSVRMPGVASAALRSELSDSHASATVVGSASHAVWLLLDGGGVVVVSTRDATRLPNSVEVAADAEANVFGSIEHGSPATVGIGQVMLDGLTIDAVRWWDPRPALPTLDRARIAESIVDLPSTVDGMPLDAIPATDSPAGLVAAASMLIGRGEGLTPEGDDYLAGVLSALRLFGEAVGDRRLMQTLDATSLEISSLARQRTTTFSAALIDHALKGNVALPAAAFLRAVAGRGDIRASHRDLLAVGHSSGPALAAGIVLGGRSVSSLTGGAR